MSEQLSGAQLLSGVKTHTYMFMTYFQAVHPWFLPLNEEDEFSVTSGCGLKTHQHRPGSACGPSRILLLHWQQCSLQPGCESRAGLYLCSPLFRVGGQRGLAAGAVHIWAHLLSFLLLPTLGVTVVSLSGSVKKQKAALKEPVPVAL